MSAAELKEMRDEVKKFIDNADERAVRMVYAMLETDSESDSIKSLLTPDQEKILDKHIELYESGKMEFSKWEDARSRIISKK